MSTNHTTISQDEHSPILLGSTFPMALIQHEVHITPRDIHTLQTVIANRGFTSFWGHENTIKIVNALLRCDVTPTQQRPALNVSPEGYIMLNGQFFFECWIFTPNYTPGFRPAIGQAVEAAQIIDWHILQIQWIAA